MFQSQGQVGGAPDIKSAIGVLRQRLGNPYGKQRPGMPGAGPQGINPGAVTMQNGQQGITGRGGNFQPLGQAAIGRLPGGPPNPGGSGPIMAPPQLQGGMQLPPGAGGGDRSGAKPGQGGMQMADDTPGLSQMDPQQRQQMTDMVSGRIGGMNQDPSGGRGFAPPNVGQGGAVGMERFPVPGGGADQQQMQPGAAPGGAPGMPPQLLQQMQQLRGGGSPYRSLVASALGGQAY